MVSQDIDDTAVPGGSKNVASGAERKREWSTGSGILLVVGVLIVSGVLSQVVSDALNPGALTRPTMIEVVIRKLWLGHVFGTHPRPDDEHVSAWSESDVESGNAVTKQSESDTSAGIGNNAPATSVPRGGLPTDPEIGGVHVPKPLPAAEPPSPPSNPLVSRNATQDPSLSMARGALGNQMEPSEKSSASGGQSETGGIQTNSSHGPNQLLLPDLGGNSAPVAAKPPLSSVAEGDIPVFGDWEQPIPWTSPYVTDAVIDMANEPLCDGVVSIHPPPPKESPPLMKTADLFSRRVMLIMPRFGLGNAMRGYLSSVVLALLSGRQLVLFHGGPHGKVFDKLCSAFRCGFESILSENSGTSPTKMWSLLQRKKGVFMFDPGYAGNETALFETLHSNQSIFATRSHVSFDKFWLQDKRRRECVFAATKCVDLHCVHSRMARLFLAEGPTDRVAQSIKKYLRSKAPAVSVKQTTSAHIDKNHFFDLSIHIRTNTMRVEGMDSNCKTKECSDKAIAKTDKVFQSEKYWGCLDLLIRTKLGALLVEGDYDRVVRGGWRIYLATDDVALRPFFLNRLSSHGRVFYMAAEISHFGRGPTSGRDPMPTLADLFFLGRAHIMMEGKERVSSFGQFSSLMSNGSFITLNERNGRCALFKKHEGLSVHSL